VPSVLDLPTLEALHELQRALRRELARLRRRLHLQLALEFAADAAVALAAAGALLVFLDWWFRWGLPVRLVLLFLTLAGLASFLGVRALGRWRSSRLDELSLAVNLDRHRPGVGQHIADVLQLPGLLDEPSARVSPAMVRLAVQQASSGLGGSDWRSLWNRKRTAAGAGALLAAVLVPLAFAALAPRAARLSLARWLAASNERWPQATYLTVMGLDARGRLLAPRDERFLLEVRTDLPLLESRGQDWIVGGRGEPLRIRRKPMAPRAPESVVVRERTTHGVAREGTMVQVDPTRFQYEFPPAAAGSSFRLAGGDDWLGPVKIERVDRPSLAETRLRVKEPGAAYSGFRAIDDPRQHLLFLPDTQVELTLVGSENLSEIQLKVHPAQPPELKRKDERTFAAAWTLREAMTLEILLTSAATGLASGPAFLSIGTLRDREPRVTLRAAGIGNHVTPVATIPLTIGATDDLGLAALRLHSDYTAVTDDKGEPKTQRTTITIPLPAEQGRALLDHQARHEVLLQSSPPKVGTVLRYVAEADDHCARGPQTGRSSALALSVVSPDELFYEILVRQRAERSKFLAALETAEKQGPVLAGQPSADDLLRVMRIMHAGSRSLDQIAARITDSIQEMKLNQIGSPKSFRLLEEGVVDPLRALNAGPMNQLRGMLQTLAGAGSTPGATRDAARRLHTDVVTKMKEILEQMSQWESFVDVVNQVAEVLRMEHKVLQATEKAEETRAKDVFDDQP
jgi:hypothetical protein